MSTTTKTSKVLPRPQAAEPVEKHATHTAASSDDWKSGPYAKDTSASTKHAFALVRAAATSPRDPVDAIVTQALAFPPRIRLKALALAAKHDVDAVPYKAAADRLPVESKGASRRAEKETVRVREAKSGRKLVFVSVDSLGVAKGDIVSTKTHFDDDGSAYIVIRKA